LAELSYRAVEAVDIGGPGLVKSGGGFIGGGFGVAHRHHRHAPAAAGEAVEQGKFRQDLYYRLNVMSFYLPPLRERVQDIAPLARGMAARFARKFNKELFAISPEAMAAMEAFPWPGNIRQLENVIQQAVLVGNGPELLWPHLPKLIQESADSSPGASQAVRETSSLIRSREEVERVAIQRALASCNYTRARAASILGISRVTLYKKMRKYGLMEVPARAHAV